MFHIVLYQPEIPPNTGNIIRLAANTCSQLHLIKPYAFALEDKRLRRAGLDYHEWANIKEHDDFETFCASLAPGQRIFACSTHGCQAHSDVIYRSSDVLLFGPESRGLPVEIRESDVISEIIRIPMRADSRSLNLSNAAAIVLYEALRQTGFDFSVTN